MQQNPPNLRHLRAFTEVATQHSITKAAKAVHLSQPAVTQAIAKLEAKLAAPLFTRTGGGLFLTDAGSVFLNRVTRALALVNEGATEAGRVGGRPIAIDLPLHATRAQLAALIAVASTGSFSLAARSIGISQPSLHRAARDFERLSGLELFIRTGTGIALTPAARRLAQYIRLAFAELDQGIADIESLRNANSGRVVIGTLPLARTFLLPHAINALLAQRPAVDISVIDGPYRALLQGLRQGESDLLVGALRTPAPTPDIIQEPLFSDPLVIVGRAGHPLARCKALTMADLAAYPWVVPRRETPTRAHFDTLFSKAAPAHVIEASSLVLLRGLLLGSDRLTLLSAHQIRFEEAQGIFARLPFALPDTDREIGVTYRRDWQPTDTQSLFLSLLRDAALKSGSTPVSGF